MLPTTFAIEIALTCNLNCPECAIGSDIIKRPKGVMKLNQFKIIADKVMNFADYLYLHLWGEPLLNKDVIPIIQYASTYTKTNISTNGLLLTPKKAKNLITSGVHDIIVSIDGVSHDVYQKYRVGGCVKRALKALEMLQHYNTEFGKQVNIIPQFIVFKHNQHEMEDFKRICDGLELIPVFKPPYIRHHNSQFSYSDHTQFKRPHYQDLPSLRNAMSECVTPKNVFTILLDGSVVVCCHDYNNVTCFGNLFEQDVMQIWNSSNYRQFREKIASGNAPKFCIDNCMTYFLS